MYLNPVLFPPMTNRESWTLTLTVNDDDTGDLIDLTGATIQFEIRYSGPQRGSMPVGGAIPYYDFGPMIDEGPILTASIGSGITVTGVGAFTVYFSEANMRTLCPGTYDVGCTLTRDVDARQLLRGKLPILSGLVTN